MDKNRYKIFTLAFLISLSMHFVFLSIPLKIPTNKTSIQKKIFIVDIAKVSNNDKKSDEISTLESFEIENFIMDNELTTRTFKENDKIPTISPTFDKEKYEKAFLKTLEEKLNIQDYIEQEGLSGDFLFAIEIEGSGRVRSVKKLFGKGDKRLEEFVVNKIYNITFPPHSNLVVTIKVNTSFYLE